MLRGAFLILFISQGFCSLWPKGVVHFAINTKDYDLHSQDVILTTFSDLQKELCIKFFNTPPGFNASVNNKILYITNPDKIKDCPPLNFNFNNSVVGEDPSRSYLLSSSERNYINAHYHFECDSFISHGPETRRSASNVGLSMENIEYYTNKLWPYGIVFYKIEDGLRSSTYAAYLRKAMRVIELETCVVFREVTNNCSGHPKPRYELTFAKDGSEAPNLGFLEEEQVVSLKSMIEGAPKHTGHTINLLLRALGIPMMSNRPDRDSYVTIHWSNVQKGKEFYLEKYPMEAWVQDSHLPYDFDSVTHAPANFMCADCNKGQATVVPAHDYLWQKLMAMGHRTELSEGDKTLVDLLYTQQCLKRQVAI